MIILQKFGFKDSRYERPQDAWVCGRLADGNPCEQGPRLDGRCCATTVCRPRLENDRWQCRRAGSAGGPCPKGPFPDGRCCMPLEPCVPHRSLRSKRRRAVIAGMALMIGLIGLFMGGDKGRHFMMPGKLSSHHAGLTDCSSCHSGAQSGQVDLLHRLVTTVEPRQNSNLCLTCHVMGAEPFAPHTHAVDDLERLSEKLRVASKDWQPESLTQRIAFPATVKARGAEMEIQCATCHKEHQGVFANLKTVSNQRCQTCHVSRISSFSDSHPQFVKYPYQRRPRIAFDHQSHMAKYFPDAVKAAIAGQVALDNCADCHQVGVRQRYMEVKSFTTMCSGCHSGDLTGATQVSGSKGIDVLAVPGLDVATLGQRGVDIGSWPDRSEATLTPFMKLLLNSEADSLVSGVDGLDLLDLRKADDQTLERVGRLAWAVKRLLNRLETTNPPSAKLLTDGTLGAQLDPVEMAALTGGMSHDVVASGNREWFPRLQEEMLLHDQGKSTRDPATAVKASTVAPESPAVSSENPAKPGSKSSSAEILGAHVGGGKDEILGSDNAPAGKKEDILGSGDGAASDKNDDILAKDDRSDILGAPKQDDILAPKKDDILVDNKPAAADDILSGSNDKGTELDPGAKNSGTEVKKSAESKSAEKAARFDPEVWAQTGGWYRQDFTIRYRPTGHADQFLRSWLDFAGSGYGSGLHDLLAPIFDTLSPKGAVGRCSKCHSIDDLAGAKLVNWLPFDPNALKNRFTNYSHKPHVELIGTKTCIKCHEMQPAKNEFMETYDQGNPADYTPNFKPLDKAVCSSCHSEQTAWENCTLCHGYHVLDANAKLSPPVGEAIFDKPALSAKSATATLSDMNAGREYTMAAALGTEQAWAEFVARHPAGRYYDLAMTELAKLAIAAKPAPATSDSVLPMEPVKQGADDPRESPGGISLSKAIMSDHPANAAGDSSASPPPVVSEQTEGNEPARQAMSDDAAVLTNAAKPSQSLEIVGDGEPTDLEGFLRRGHERAVRGDFQLARQDFDEVIRRNPKHAVALDDRCWVLALLDEVKAALEDCNASLRAAPRFADALDSRGFVNLKLGLYQNAIVDYSAALSQFRGAKRASALYGRGIAKRRMGLLARGDFDLDAAKALKPKIADEFSRYGIR
jgi:tetratricopeptide (TPR) repeat protein